MLRRILPSAKLGHRVIKRFQSNQVDPNTPYLLQSLAWFLFSAGGVGINGYIFWECEKDYKRLFNEYSGRKIMKGVMTIPEDFNSSEQIELETKDRKIKMLLGDSVKFNPTLKEQVGVPMNVYVYGKSDYPFHPLYVGGKDDTFKWARNDVHVFPFYLNIGIIGTGTFISGYFLHQMKRSLIRLR